MGRSERIEVVEGRRGGEQKKLRRKEGDKEKKKEMKTEKGKVENKSKKYVTRGPTRNLQTNNKQLAHLNK